MASVLGVLFMNSWREISWCFCNSVKMSIWQGAKVLGLNNKALRFVNIHVTELEVDPLLVDP